MQRHALNLQQLRDLVARGARNGRDDGQFCPRQGVEQRALARVGLAGNHHLDAFAQDGALLGFLHHRLQPGLQALELAFGVGLRDEVNVFFRKVQSGFHQHAQVRELRQQGGNFLRKLARQRARGRARGGFGAGINQVGNGLGLRQVDFVVQKSPLRELARLGRAQAWQQGLAGQRIGLGCCLQAALQQQLQHHRPAMGLQFKHVLAGVRVRGREKQGQALVYGLAGRVQKRTISGQAWLQLLARELLGQSPQARARDTHHAHRAPAGGGGDGDDGVLVAGKHGAQEKRAACSAALAVLT